MSKTCPDCNRLMVFLFTDWACPVVNCRGTGDATRVISDDFGGYSVIRYMKSTTPPSVWHWGLACKDSMTDAEVTKALRESWSTVTAYCGRSKHENKHKDAFDGPVSSADVVSGTIRDGWHILYVVI